MRVNSVLFVSILSFILSIYKRFLSNMATMSVSSNSSSCSLRCDVYFFSSFVWTRVFVCRSVCVKLCVCVSLWVGSMAVVMYFMAAVPLVVLAGEFLGWRFSWHLSHSLSVSVSRSFTRQQTLSLFYLFFSRLFLF